MSSPKPSPVLSRRHGWLSLGEKLSDLISGYGRPGVPQPTSNNTARQALELLGFIQAGGSDTAASDALSKVADDTITDGVDYALGTVTGTKIGTGTTQKLGLWNATPIVQPANTVDIFTGLVNVGLRAAAGTAAMTLPGNLAAAGSIKSSGTLGIGYATGAGGTVTQSTDKTTGVTLSKMTGVITLNNASLADATNVQFTVTNTLIEAGDFVVVNHISGGTLGVYAVHAHSVAAGSFKITVRNQSGGALGEALAIRVGIFKGVSA